MRAAASRLPDIVTRRIYAYPFPCISSSAVHTCGIRLALIGAGRCALSLTEALVIADRESSLLAAQRSAITAAEATTASARELPDPKLKLGIDNLPADGPDRYSLTRDFMTMRKIGVAQEFVRGEKREIKGRRAENELYREQALLGDARAALRRDVALPWLERYFAERMAAVVDEQYAETDLQRETLQAGLRAGKAQPADLLAVQDSLQSLLDRRAEYRRHAARATAMLSRWLRCRTACSWHHTAMSQRMPRTIRICNRWNGRLMSHATRPEQVKAELQRAGYRLTEEHGFCPTSISSCYSRRNPDRQHQRPQSFGRTGSALYRHQ